MTTVQRRRDHSALGGGFRGVVPPGNEAVEIKL
jgi:hypothetical protein